MESELSYEKEDGELTDEEFETISDCSLKSNGILNDLSDELENILSTNEEEDGDSDNIDSDEQDEYELRLIALRSLINKSPDTEHEDLVDLEKSLSDFEVIDEADYSDNNDDAVDNNNQNIGESEVSNQKDEICHMSTDNSGNKENQIVKKFQNTEEDEDEDILRAMLLASVSKKIAKVPNNVVPNLKHVEPTRKPYHRNYTDRIVIELTNSDFEDEINEDITRKSNNVSNFEQRLTNFLIDARANSTTEQMSQKNTFSEIKKQLDILENKFSLSNKRLTSTRKPINGNYRSILTVNNVAIPKNVPKHITQQSSVFKKTKFSLVKRPDSLMKAKMKNLMSINRIKKSIAQSSTGNLSQTQSESLSHPFSLIANNILPKSAESTVYKTPVRGQSQRPTPAPTKGPVLTAETKKKQESFKEQVLRAKKNREDAEVEYKKVYQQLKVTKLRYLTTHHVYKLLLQEYVKLNNRKQEQSKSVDEAVSSSTQLPNSLPSSLPLPCAAQFTSNSIENETNDILTRLNRFPDHKNTAVSQIPYDSPLDLNRQLVRDNVTDNNDNDDASNENNRYQDNGISFNGFRNNSTFIDEISNSIPASLLRKINSKEITGIGKMKVVLRVKNHMAMVEQHSSEKNCVPFFSIDKKKKQVTLFDPSLVEKLKNLNRNEDQSRKLPIAPKIFLFDALFTSDDTQNAVCSSALSDIIHAVIEGNDGCLFCLGHADVGKSFTMFGSPSCGNDSGNYGAIFYAIIWLFRCVHERKLKTGAKFSLRVSAIEICGSANTIKDLLVDYINEDKSITCEDPPFITNQLQLQNSYELRVASVERAVFYLNAALNRRSKSENNSHFLFSIHVYQYNVNGVKVAGARSCLHVLDIGSCISLSGLGNILLAIFNGQKHLPYRDHKLTHVLKDCLGSLMCQVSIIVHVSNKSDCYIETLTTIQLASRIHRIRRRRFKFLTSNMNNFEDTAKVLSNSEPDPSSSDLSADTVIYLGPSIDDATDNEHPPMLLSNFPQPKLKPIHKLVQQSPQKTSIKSPSKQSGKSPMKKVVVKTLSEEKWIDGPKISKQTLFDRQRSLKVKQNETWIDGPSPKKSSYGFMDTYKKDMIKKWIETQTKSHYQDDVKSSRDHNEDDDEDVVDIPPALPLITPLSSSNSRGASVEDLMLKEKRWEQLRKQECCDNLEMLEVQVPLLSAPMQDRSIQVTENDIDYYKYMGENPLPESDQGSYDHLNAFSEDNMTIVSTFTDSLSILNDFEKIFVSGQYGSIDRRTEQFLKTQNHVSTDDVESLDRHNMLTREILSPELNSLYSEPMWFDYSRDFQLKKPTFFNCNFAKIEPIKTEPIEDVCIVPEFTAQVVTNSNKHSPATVSRRAESGYHSSSMVPEDIEDDIVNQRSDNLVPLNNMVVFENNGGCRRYRKGSKRKSKNYSICSWLLRPFTCKYIEDLPETQV